MQLATAKARDNSGTPISAPPSDKKGEGDAGVQIDDGQKMLMTIALSS
jgi:hypothetical protein